MNYSFKSFIAIIGGCLLLAVALPLNAAAIDNAIVEPRIYSSDDLISTIVDKCFTADGMHCIKEKVLTYLDTVSGIEEQISGRAFDDDVIDKVIVDRVARILNTNEIRVQLPETVFANSVLSYRVDRGFDLEIPQSEARRDKKKDKLFLPLLLLMKFKLKVIMPIMMSLIGLKAFKALILSKIAIKLVLGFLIYNLIQKLGGMKMTMMPMPHPPAAEYGVPSSTVSSYDPSSWEPMNGGPYARSDAHYMAYSAYQPSSSSNTYSNTS
uniref:Osiris 20 n=1 Tax=Glossina austeni TaxID=7395 RepID=A0A1A9VDP1_GLOAU